MEPTTETKNPGDAPEKVVEKIEGIVKKYEQSTTDSRQEMNDIFAVYMGKMDEVQNVPYDVKEAIPKLRTEIAYIKPFIFSGNPEIEIEGVGEEDKTISAILEKIVNYRIQQSIPNAYEKIEAWVHQAVTFGTSVLRVIWRFETEEKVEQKEVIDEETGETTLQEEKHSVPVIDEPDIDVPNILDVYYNPIIADIESQPCLVFRSVHPIKWVKENPLYDFKDEFGQLNREKVEGAASITNKKNSSGQTSTDIPNAQSKANDGMVEVFEYIDKEHIQTIANGKLLRDSDNPYGLINAVKFIFEPNTIPNRFAGLGVGQNTLGLGKMHFKMWNQTAQNVKMANNQRFIYKKGHGIDPKEFISKPAGGIGVDSDTDESLSNIITPIIVPDIKDGAIQILSKLDDEIKRASGATDLVQGSASNDTAAQDQIAQANVSNRFELIQRRFKQALASVAEMIIKMEIQNLQSPEASILRIFPEDLREGIYQLLVNEGANVKFNVKVRGETNVARNKNLESKRLVELFNQMAPFLTDKEKRAFGRRIAELQGINNVDEIIGEENQELVAQQQAQQAQLGMPGMEGMQGAQGMQGIQQEQPPIPRGAETQGGLVGSL